jgi:hypothetical protein
MGTIYTKPLSRYGFLRFHATSGLTVSGGNVTTPIQYSDNDTLPFNNYTIDKVKYHYSNPIKSSASDKITLCTTLESGTFSSNTVIIVDVSTGLAVSGAAVAAQRYNDNKSIIVQITYNNSNSNRPINAILVVGNGALVSNQFLLLPVNEPFNFTKVFYQEVTDWYDFNYTEDITIGSYTGKPFNELFVGLNMVSFGYPNDSTQYRNVTDGKIRIIKQIIDQEFTIETYWLDFYAHEAFSVALNHSTFKLNDVAYILGSGASYEITSDPTMYISKGTATLTNVPFTRKNKPCTTLSES